MSIPRILRATCDASFKRKDERDDRSRGGYLLCVGTSEQDTVGLISYGSSKIHRVCKSPTGAEAVTITATGDQIDTAYHLLFWFYPTADPTGEILTDAQSVTSSQYKYCSDVSPNLTVDFALIRQRVRDGLHNLRHQFGQFQAADGLTKFTNEAVQPLMQFLKDNQLGSSGVNAEELDTHVEKRIQHNLHNNKVHPKNINTYYIKAISHACVAEILHSHY